MTIEYVIVKPVTCLGLTPDELHALQKNRLRVILVGDNACEYGVVIGKEERKAFDAKLKDSENGAV